MMLLTVGHAALDRHGLGELLRGAGVGAVVDVRRYPASRTNPDVAREALEQWLPGTGVAYRWEPRLGGRRHLGAADRAASPDTWWQVEAFRAYAAWTRTREFDEALRGVLAAAGGRPGAPDTTGRADDPGAAGAAAQADRAPGEGTLVGVMCAEAVWWRCHRRVIADVATLAHGADVGHLMPDGTLRPHVPAAGARLGPDGTVVWDRA